MIGLVQIPGTSEAVDAKGVYTVFNIHVNGSYHGSFRYSQLLTLHQELKAKFDTKSLDEFPGKHWFSSLSAEQLLARRIGLERYLHSVCQDRTIGNSDLLKEFFIAVQKASGSLSELSGLGEGFEGELQVFLVNGKSVSVKVGTYDRTDQVLERVCQEIQLASDLTYYFALFIEKQQEGEETWTLTRPLTDFECPYISMQIISKTGNYRVAIRKSFWDPVFLPELCEDRVAKNLLYLEALAAVGEGHWDMTPDVRKQLASLQKKNQKKQYLELAGTLHQYGFMHLADLQLDHPKDDIIGSIRVGKMEMISYVSEDSELATKVYSYPLTRIKSWKLGGKPGSPWLKFFFQLGAADFTPVAVVGGQSILLSHCLHSVVDELLRVRAKQEIRRPSKQRISREPRTLPSLVVYESPTTPADSEVNAEDTPTQEVGSEVESEEEATPTPKKPETTAPTNSTADPTPPRLASVSSVEETDSRPVTKPSAKLTAKPTTTTKVKEVKVKTPKKPQSMSSPDVENPTFAFGTDDDL